MTSQRLSIFKKIFGGLMALPMILMGSLFIFPLPAQALADVEDPLTFTPQITIPNSSIGASTTASKYDEKTGKMESDLLARYINSIYNYGLTIAGIVATMVLMGGGIVWLTSGGDAGKVSQAKGLIGGSIVGIIILLCAWIILNTINPDLVKLKTISTEVIKKISYCCDANKGHVAMTLEEGGSCPSGSSLCGKNEVCRNIGDDKFTCVQDEGSTCCEYLFYSMNGTNKFHCTTVKGNMCPKFHNQYPLTNSYQDKYCGEKVAYGGCLLGQDCPGQADGSVCSDGASFCYKEICYINKGKENEPCGDRKGAICLKGTALNPCPDYFGHNYARLNLWGIFVANGPINSRGRDCDSGLYCCAPTPNDK